MMIKQTLKSVIKPLLLTASLVVLGAPPLAYATHREKHLLSQEEISKRANVFLDALERQNPELLASFKKNTSYRRDILDGIVSYDRLVLSNIQSLPKEVGSLENLILLTIMDSSLTELPQTIGELKNLWRLRISMVPLKELPPTIGNLEKLDALSIESQQLAELPKEIGNLKNLKNLVIRSSGLKNFPETISGLQALESLAFTNNKKLTNLPGGIERLNKDVEIGLYGTPLSKLFGISITLDKFLEKREIITKGALVSAALEPKSQKKPEALKGSELSRLPQELREHIVNDMAAASLKDNK
jgi:Leucine-rich repeat (LRR) protein